MKVVVSGETVPESLQDYCTRREIAIELLDGVVGSESLRDAVSDADYYLLGGDEVLSNEVLSAAPRLRAVSFLGAGAASFVDLDAASARGVAVLNTPGVNSDAVAEFTVGQALALQRRMFADALGGSAVVRDTDELTGSTVGIVGLGSIGSRVARILKLGFGCNVLYCSPSNKPEVEAELGIDRVALDELFRRSSTVFVCCPSTDSTTGLIGATQLEAGADYIVSIADPRVIDLGRLASALAGAQIKGAALDGEYVGAAGTSPEDSAALDVHRGVSLFVTRHIAASSHASWSRMQERAVENLIEAIETRTS